MQYFFVGIVLGIALNLLGLWQPTGAIEIYSEWHGKIDSIDNIENSDKPSISRIKLFPIKTERGVFILSGNGALLDSINIDNHLISISRNATYIVRYDKIGVSIEFSNIKGDRYWKIKSREYPYISSNGKIILLMNGDHSRIRIIDFNGNEIGEKSISGRFCTTVSFSKYSDFAGIGFLDGSYYILNSRGDIIDKGIVPQGSLIKGISISNYGEFIAIHYGNNDRDRIRLVDLERKRAYIIPLEDTHLAKTAINVLDDGSLSIIDHNRILITDQKGRIQNIIKIHSKKHGLSTIDYADGIYVASYTRTDGVAQFLIYRKDGALVFSRRFPEEGFLATCIKDSVILLRGNQSLFCYNYFCPDNQ